MNRLGISLVTFILVTSIGLGLLFDYAYHTVIEPVDSAVDPRLEQISALIMPLATLIDATEPEQQQNLLHENTKDIQLTIRSEVELALPKTLKDKLNRGEVLTLEDDQDITIIKRLERSGQLLVLSLPPENPANTTPWVRVAFTTLFYLVLMGVTLLWLYPLVRRLMLLRRTTHTFGQGQLEARISVSKVSYIRDIERDFNQMAQRIDNLIGDMKLLTSAVSHDLRTPLAKIRLGLDVLMDEQDTQKRKKYEARINQHLDDMLNLIETILDYARLEHTRLHIKPVAVPLTPILLDLTERWKDEGKIVSFNTTGNPKPVLVDQKYLNIALNNIMQNATTYANQHVNVILEESNGNVAILISDDGKGIGSLCAEKLFMPFYRGKQTQAKGFGMGLAIVKRIIEWHNADVKVDSCPILGGARFTITFSNVTYS